MRRPMVSALNFFIRHQDDLVHSLHRGSGLVAFHGSGPDDRRHHDLRQPPVFSRDQASSTRRSGRARACKLGRRSEGGNPRHRLETTQTAQHETPRFPDVAFVFSGTFLADGGIVCRRTAPVTELHYKIEDRIFYKTLPSVTRVYRQLADTGV